MAFPANTALLTQSFQLLNSLRTKLKDRSDERNDSDYEELRQAALNVRDLRERVRSLDAEGRRALLAAGPVAQSARLRVASAREDLDGNVSDWLLRASKAADESSTKMGKAVKKFRRNPKKTSKRVAKRAEKAAQQVTDKMTGKAARRAERPPGPARDLPRRDEVVSRLTCDSYTRRVLAPGVGWPGEDGLGAASGTVSRGHRLFESVGRTMTQ